MSIIILLKTKKIKINLYEFIFEVIYYDIIDNFAVAEGQIYTYRYTISGY